jgi:hypothetical protein
MVFALALGAMFVLLYFSVYMAAEDKNRLIQELQAGMRADAAISRTVNPENVTCFAADDIEVTKRYPSLLQGIRDADQAAQEDERSDSRHGNYYTGVGIGLDKADMLSMIEAYSFNRTIYHVPSVDKLFTYENQQFSRGFSYSGNYYRLIFTFTALEGITRDLGYVPVRITQGQVQEADSPFPITKAATYAPFNNTAVFFNELSSPVTIDIVSKDTGISETVALPPGRMQDVHLAADWSGFEEAAYHYKVREYPGIEGSISVSPEYSSGCLSRETARSLYLQSGFAVKFPSYLPEGFGPGCIAENTDSYVIQIYANQTAYEHHMSKGMMHSRGNFYPFYLHGSMPEEDAKGIVQVHAQKHYFENAREQGYAMYQYMLNNTWSGFATDPQFFELGGDSSNNISYLTFSEGKFLSVVVVLAEDESYRLVGALPMDEMLRIAESLA